MKKLSSETVSNESRLQYHIQCAPGDISEYILLVGDPARAEIVAQKFDSIQRRKTHREFVTLTGKYQKLPLTVMATGIGQDNTEIAMIEACQITQNPTFLRCGSSGSIQKEPNIGDVIISKAALRLGNTCSFFVPEGYPAVADNDIVLALAAACREKKIPYHLGITASAPGFYGAQGRSAPGFPIRYPNLSQELQRIKILNFEMETEALFVLAQLRGIRAGAICAVFGNRPRKVFADEPMRKKAEARCIEASLQAFLFLHKMDQYRKKENLSLWLPPNDWIKNL